MHDNAKEASLSAIRRQSDGSLKKNGKMNRQKKNASQHKAKVLQNKLLAAYMSRKIDSELFLNQLDAIRDTAAAKQEAESQAAILLNSLRGGTNGIVTLQSSHFRTTSD